MSDFDSHECMENSLVLTVMCHVLEYECMRRCAPVINDHRGRRPHQAWVSQYRPDMYFQRCVRSELRHEGPPFSAKYAGPRPKGGCCVSRFGNDLGFDNMFKLKSQWKSTVMSGNHGHVGKSSPDARLLLWLALLM